MKQEALQPSRDRQDRALSLRIPLIAGLVMSLSVGFADVLISVFRHEPAAFSSPLALFLPLAATAVTFLLAYSVLCFLIVLPLARRLALDGVALAVSLALFAGLSFPLASVGDVIQVLFRLDLSRVQQVRGIVSLSICLPVSVAGYFVGRAALSSGCYRKAASSFSLALPLALAEVTAIAWLWKYPLGSAGSLRGPLGGLCVLMVLSTILLSNRLAPKIRVEKPLGAFMAVVVCAALLAFLPSKGSSPSPAGRPLKEHRIKHVILLTVDTLRPDFLSCYRFENAPTPNIDRLARDGILFRTAYSESPWTLPTVCSIMTGFPPTVHLATTAQSRLPDSLTTLAESMLKDGYFTAAIGRNGCLRAQHNLSQGFLQYDFFPAPSLGQSFGARFLRRVLFPGRFKECPTTDDLTRLASDWLEENSERHSLLWLHYFDPHQPYEPPANLVPQRKPPSRIGLSFAELKRVRGGFFAPSAEEREWIQELYRGEARQVDQSIGVLLDTLETLGIYDESLIILTSDHGEEFWEHGGYEHGHTLYNELLWIPLILKLPRSEFAGTEVGETVSNSAILPTILDLCGIGSGGDVSGSISLASMWGSDAPASPSRPVVSTGLLYYEERVSVIADGVKYIRSRVTGREELYDLEQDPEERTSIASYSPEKLQKVRDIVESHDRTAEQQRRHLGIQGPDSVVLDRESEQQLKALGYMN